jgi:hypothetical protein
MIVKAFVTSLGIVAQTVLGLLVIGAADIRGSQYPLLYLLVLIQVPLATAIWVKEARVAWRFVAYLCGLAVSIAAFWIIVPRLQSVALEILTNSLAGAAGPFFGFGLVALGLYVVCALSAFLATRAIARLGQTA